MVFSIVFSHISFLIPVKPDSIPIETIFETLIFPKSSAILLSSIIFKNLKLALNKPATASASMNPFPFSIF